MPGRDDRGHVQRQLHGLAPRAAAKGAVVSSLSLDEISALFEFRPLVEAELIRRSVERIRPETRDEASRHAEACARETGRARDRQRAGRW